MKAAKSALPARLRYEISGCANLLRINSVVFRLLCHISINGIIEKRKRNKRNNNISSSISAWRRILPLQYGNGGENINVLLAAGEMTAKTWREKRMISTSNGVMVASAKKKA